MKQFLFNRHLLRLQPVEIGIQMLLVEGFHLQDLTGRMRAG